MKYTLCFLGILILLFSSCADKLKIGEDQSTSFIKFYGNMWVDNGNDVKNIPVSKTFPNGGYAIAGYTTKTINRNPGDKDMLFLILDRFGNIVGKPKQYGGPGDDEATRVDVLANGAGFILTGFRTIHDTLHASVMRLNSAGDSVWNYISSIPGSSAEKALNIHIDSATNIYTVVGYQTQNNQNGWIFDLQDKGDHYIYNGSSFNSNIFQVLQYYNTSTALSYNLNTEFIDIGILSSNSVFLLGSLTLPIGTGIPVLYRSAEFDATKQVTYVIGNNDWVSALIRKINDSPKQMIILPGNKSALLSSIDTINTSTHFVHLAILNDPANPTSSQSSNWYYFDATAGFNGGSLDAVKMKFNVKDSTFIILATLIPSTSSTNSSIILIKADGRLQGKEIWRRTLGNNDLYVAGGLDFTPDGGYIVTGYNNTGGYNQAVLVIKTNQDGFIE